MAQRYYICPIVIDPTDATNRIPRVMLHPHRQATACVSVDTSGALLKTWALVRVESDDYTVMDADSTCMPLFDGLTDALQTKTDLVAWLKSRKWADVPSALRTRINNRLQAVGVDTSSIGVSNSLFDIALLAMRALQATRELEGL